MRQTSYRRPAGLHAIGLATPVLMLAVAGSLAACGQPSPADGGDGVGPTVSVAVQPTILPETSTAAATNPSAPSSGGLFDASQSLVSSACTVAGDVWSFTGRLENTDTSEHAFTVGVFVTATADGSQVGGQEIVVKVPAGGSAPVEAKAFYTGRTKGVECLTGVTVKAAD